MRQWNVLTKGACFSSIRDIIAQTASTKFLTAMKALNLISDVTRRSHIVVTSVLWGRCSSPTCGLCWKHCRRKIFVILLTVARRDHCDISQLTVNHRVSSSHSETMSLEMEPYMYTCSIYCGLTGVWTDGRAVIGRFGNLLTFNICELATIKVWLHGPYGNSVCLPERLFVEAGWVAPLRFKLLLLSAECIRSQEMSVEFCVICGYQMFPCFSSGIFALGNHISLRAAAAVISQSSVANIWTSCLNIKRMLRSSDTVCLCDIIIRINSDYFRKQH
jgi:hypothetical protein